MKTTVSFIKTIFVIIMLCGAFTAYSQSEEGVSMGDSLKPADPSAILELFSETKGFLLPRMTTEQRDSIESPATGLIIFDTDKNHFFYYNAGWKEFGFWKAKENDIYYDLGRVGINSDTIIYPLTVKGTQGIASWVSGDTVPQSPMPVSNIFGGNFTGNTASYVNTAISSVVQGAEESAVAGLAAWVENNGAQTVGITTEAYYTGAGATSLEDELIPMVGGIMGGALVEDPDAIVIAVGNYSSANSDHKGLNIGASSQAYSETTYGNIGEMNMVNVSDDVTPYFDSLFTRFPDRVTIASLSHNEASDSADFNIYASGNAKSYFEGNVGIGTISPEAKLHVAGDFLAENATASKVTVNDTLKIPGGAQQGYVLTSDAGGAASWQAPATYHTSVSLSSSQILNIFSTPIELIPAPGSGKKIVPTQIVYKYNYGTTTYTQTGSKGFSIGFPSGNSSSVVQQTGIFGFTSNCYLNLPLVTSAAPPVVATHFYDNEPIKIYGILANPAAGDGTAQVDVFYMVIPY